jgi:hypothetical protein
MTEPNVDLFRKIIFENECGGDKDIALEFSDPDGVRSGKSGWSFGVCQFDLANNPLASVCLKECGFTDDEVVGLKAQTIDPKPLEAKLRKHADIIERYDDHQLEGCLTRARVVLERFGILPSDDTALLAVADYDNQYHLDSVNSPKTLVGYLSWIGKPFLAKDVLDFKLNFTKYGKEHPVDCKRRYMNILKIVQNA